MILLLVTSALAQDVPEKLTLQQTIQLAVARNPDHRSAELAETIAEIEQHRARLDRFTAKVTGTGSAEAGVVKPWGEELYRGTQASWDARATVGVPLYAGGAIRASIDQADANAGIASIDRVLTERSLARAAYTAYWNIRGYELRIAATEEGLDLTQQSLAIIEAKANAGLAAGIDVNRSKVELYSQQDSLVSEKAALVDAEQDLLQLLHLPGGHVELADEAPAASTEPVQLPEDAGKDRPELHRKDLEAAGADAAIRAARAAALPTLSLTGTAGLGNTTQGVSNLGDAGKFDAANLAPTFDASVGLELTWNPFDLFRVRDAVAEARLAAEQVEAGRDTQKDQIAADLRKAAANVDALRQRVPLVDAQVALARDNLQIVQGLYAQGSATILDLFDAQSAFRQARTQGAALRVELATAECDLRWMLGEDLGAATGAQP